MTNLRIIILSIILSINFLSTLIFLIYFIKRFFKIRSSALTNKACSDAQYFIRMLVNLIYIAINLATTIIELFGLNQDNQEIMVIILSFGFLFASLILILHMVIVRMQLKKQFPTSNLHKRFFIYLIFVSLQQLALSVYQIKINQSDCKICKIIITVLICFQLIDSFAMLILWERRLKFITIFSDVINMTTKKFNAHLKKQSKQNNSISQTTDKICTQHWNLILPTVLFQFGKITIILQTYTNNNILNFLHEQQNSMPNSIEAQPYYSSYSNFSKSKKKPPQNQHLQIISKNQYTKEQIQKIYLICNRFNHHNNIQFISYSTDNYYYTQVQKFIQELFTINAVYIPEILQLFSIDKQQINSICDKAKKIGKANNQLLVSTFVDHNAFFLSIEIFKQLWTHNHFIFYIHTIAMDTKEKAVCWKRYSDFEEFHSKLQQTIKNQIKTQFNLPNLPKKYFLSLKENDEEKVYERRKQLQKYCRETFNDYQIMTRIPTAKDQILQFLQLKNTTYITPHTLKATQFYDGLQIGKGNIYKSMVGQQFVTFYQFLLYQNQIQVRNIKKRFRQFKAFDLTLKKWMNNLQIVYKFIVLPDSHLQKSETKRHEKLITYLEGVLSIKGIYKLYAANQFFSMGQCFQSQMQASNKISIIKRSSVDESSKANEQSQNLSQLSRSLLIQRLGSQ